jgi:hypothetical protein
VCRRPKRVSWHPMQHDVVVRQIGQALRWHWPVSS